MKISGLATVILLLSAANSFAADGLACYQQLPVPEYPAKARVDGVEASVFATVEVTADGSLGKIDTTVLSISPEATTIFVPAVEAAVRSAKANKECAGQKVSVAFRFRRAENLTQLSPSEATWVIQIPSGPIAAVTESNRPRSGTPAIQR